MTRHACDSHQSWYDVTCRSESRCRLDSIRQQFDMDVPFCCKQTVCTGIEAAAIGVGSRRHLFSKAGACCATAHMTMPM